MKAISIGHISDSINTHGLGVINTCVDVVFKFVTMRLNNFTQMMMEETLISYLQREARWMEKQREKGKQEKEREKIEKESDKKRKQTEEEGVTDNKAQKYDLERGQKFLKELALASTREKGVNIVEKFRMLITSLGNALGFARILRTASFNYLSKNIEYIPFIENVACSFEDTATVLNYGNTSKDCCAALDTILDVLRNNFG